MNAPASYEFEYAAFNENPGVTIKGNNEWMFTDPVRIFSTGPTGRKEAEAFVRDGNDLRRAARLAPHRNNLEVDKAAGLPVSMVVRKRLLVALAWEPASD